MNPQENINEYPWLLFKIFSVTYAVSSKQITAISNLPPDITKLPDQTENMRGIMGLRGNHIKVLGTRALFNVIPLEVQKMNADEQERERLDHLHEMVIVFEIGDSTFGIAVDEVMSVDEIELLHGHNINNSVFRSRLVNGVGKTIKSSEVVLLLDYMKLAEVDAPSAN